MPRLSDTFDLIEDMLEHDAVHNRKGFRLTQIGADEILGHVDLELKELSADQDNIEELADCIAPLIQYAVSKGWSECDVAEAIRRKLSLRFNWPNNPDPNHRSVVTPTPPSI